MADLVDGLIAATVVGFIIAAFGLVLIGLVQDSP